MTWYRLANNYFELDKPSASFDLYLAVPIAISIPFAVTLERERTHREAAHFRRHIINLAAWLTTNGKSNNSVRWFKGLLQSNSVLRGNCLL